MFVISLSYSLPFLTLLFINFVGSFSSPTSLFPSHRQLPWFLLFTKFVGSLSSPASLVPSLHQLRWFLLFTNFVGSFSSRILLVPSLHQLRWFLLFTNFVGFFSTVCPGHSLYFSFLLLLSYSLSLHQYLSTYTSPYLHAYCMRGLSFFLFYPFSINL